MPQDDYKLEKILNFDHGNQFYLFSNEIYKKSRILATLLKNFSTNRVKILLSSTEVTVMLN